jgi:hypothetical protein
MDKLTEIEAYWTRMDPTDARTDIMWLVNEVKRLRKREEALLQLLTHAASDNAALDESRGRR